MAQTQRWYRLITMGNLAHNSDAYIAHVKTHIETEITNLVTYSFLSAWSGDGIQYGQLITTIITNGSKSVDDAEITTLATHLTIDHGFQVVVSEVDSEQIYP